MEISSTFHQEKLPMDFTGNAIKAGVEAIQWLSTQGTGNNLEITFLKRDHQMVPALMRTYNPKRGQGPTGLGVIIEEGPVYLEVIEKARLVFPNDTRLQGDRFVPKSVLSAQGENWDPPKPTD